MFEFAAEGLLTFAAFFVLMGHLSARTRRRLLGYKGWVDIVMHGACGFLLVTTGAFSSMIVLEVAALMFSGYLYMARWLFGYERFDARESRWRRYAGKFT